MDDDVISQTLEDILGVWGWKVNIHFSLTKGMILAEKRGEIGLIRTLEERVIEWEKQRQRENTKKRVESL